MRLIGLFCLFVGHGHAKPTNDGISSAIELANVRDRLILCEFRESRRESDENLYLNSLDREKNSNEELMNCRRKNHEMTQEIIELKHQIAKLQRR